MLLGNVFMYFQLQVLYGNSYYIDPPLTKCFHYAYAKTYQRCIFLRYLE